MKITRREALAQVGALALAQSKAIAAALPALPGEEVVPFLDQPPVPPEAPGPWPLNGVSMLDWQNLGSWITPNEGFFRVGHYDKPVVEEGRWQLDVTGLVRNPSTYRLSDLKAMPRRDVTFTLECSGNNGFPWFWGGIGNAKWTGCALAPILERAGLLDERYRGGVLWHGRRRRGGPREQDPAELRAQHVARRRDESREPSSATR